MGKTKRNQLQSWNILTFDPQKTDVDEHIDLLNTLGNMLGQTAAYKMEKFVDTMPTIIQTHLMHNPISHNCSINPCYNLLQFLPHNY